MGRDASVGLLCALCTHCKEKGEDFGREMLVRNGALKAGTPSLPSETFSSSSPSLCPQEANVKGSRARVATYLPTTQTPLGCTRFRDGLRRG